MLRHHMNITYFVLKQRFFFYSRFAFDVFKEPSVG